MKIDSAAAQALIAELQRESSRQPSISDIEEQAKQFDDSKEGYKTPNGSFLYWSHSAIADSRFRDECQIYVRETIFAGAAILFLYLVTSSPFTQPLTVMDGLVVLAIVACTQTVTFHYWRLAHRLRLQIDDAIYEANRSAEITLKKEESRV